MALHDQPVTDIDWKTVTEQEWKEVYVVAAEQGVMALAWDGLQQVMGDFRRRRCQAHRDHHAQWHFRRQQGRDRRCR